MFNPTFLEERFLELLQHSTDILSILELDGTLRYVSPSVERILGYTPQELIGTQPVEGVHPQDLAEVVVTLESAQQQPAVPGTITLRYRHKQGHWIYLELAGSNLAYHPGLQGIVVSARDVTTQKKAEEQLRQSHSMFNFALEAAQIGIWDYDPQKDEIRWSDQVESFLGCEIPTSPSRCSFAAFLNRVIPPHQERVQRAVQAAFEHQAELHLEYQMELPDGQQRWYELKGRASLDQQGQPLRLSGIVQDITARVEASSTLHQIENQLKTIVDNAPIILFSMDDEGVINLAEGKGRSPAGQLPGALVGRSIFELYGAKTEITKAFQQLMRGKNVKFETELVGNFLEIYASPLRDPQGEISGVIGVAVDITDRKQAEAALVKSQQQLLQSQKMEAVGRLAGGIAHDFNNLLTAILGYCALALGSLEKHDPLHEDMVEIQKAANRAATLTRQLLAFSRRQVLQPRVLDLNEVMAEMDKLLRRLIGEHIELITLPDPRVGLVKADPGQLEQVIVNLVVNAKDALPNGGKLILETANIELDEEYARQHPEVVAGSYVRLAVSDNGIGMDKATRSQLFEPFFTTKAVGRGTGLGLATVYGIVKQSGGHIEVYSELGQGTSFKIYLPRVKQGQTSPSQRLATTSPLPGGTETILLVEDEEGVRTLAARMLRSYGYQVIEARHGRDALLLYHKHLGKIDLLVTDVVMPYMSGRELAESLSGLQPNLKVIYTSGYTDQSIVQRGILEEGVVFLQKPFTPSQLARKVREVMDQSGTYPG